MWHSKVSVSGNIVSDDDKNDFAEIKLFFQMFGTTYLKKVHTQKKRLFSEL